mmetsp:Transcript_120608/g.323813  ORF Transcript_120608/g.323813 Transcript_120608/m.323813 type:complete len:209 (-) Transcript_120608:427-1053(-)
MRDRQLLHFRGCWPHPARGMRPCPRRRRRGCRDARRHRRIQRVQGPVLAQRRAREGFPPLGQGPRRFRHGRGCRRPVLGVLGARAGARRGDLRRVRGRRVHLRRAPHDRAAPAGRRRVALHPERAGERRRRGGRGGLHELPRHLHPRRGHGGGPRHQEGAGQHRPPGSQQHQVHGGPLPRGRRRDRGRRLRAGAAASQGAPDPEPRGP